FDWQDVGRADAAPVHWPLWPPPLPPLVGGFGLANAMVAVIPIVTAMVHVAARMRLFTWLPLPSAPSEPIGATLLTVVDGRNRWCGRGMAAGRVPAAATVPFPGDRGPLTG